MAAQGTSAALVWDLTESSLRGVPVWHERALTSGGAVSTLYPIQQYLDATDTTFGYVNIYAMGVRDGFRGATLYELKEDQSLGNLDVFDFGTGQTFKELTFQYLRAEGSPLMPNKVRLRFTDNVTLAELFSSTAGAFTSLGEIDLTSIQSKTAEWRRLGRYNEDVTFKVRFEADYVLNEFNPSSGNKAVSIIEGYFVL